MKIEFAVLTPEGATQVIVWAEVHSLLPTRTLTVVARGPKLEPVIVISSPSVLDVVTLAILGS